MKRPLVKTAKRSRSASGAVARSKTEAAIQLVRVEFDAQRLERAIQQADERAKTHRQELCALQARRKRLMAQLKT